MTEQPTEQSNVSSASNDPVGAAGIAMLLVMAGIGLTAWGLYVMYNNSYDARVVGGDAYNYIIYATRGTGWICAGVVSMLFAVVLAIYDVRRALRSRPRD